MKNLDVNLYISSACFFLYIQDTVSTTSHQYFSTKKFTSNKFQS